MMVTLDKVNWKHGLKAAIAAGVCLGLVRVVGLKPGFWACISTIVVMQSESADTLVASRDRLIGTALGALVGLGVSYFWNGHLIVYAMAVLACMLVPEIAGLKDRGTNGRRDGDDRAAGSELAVALGGGVRSISGG